eukprot:234053_1
MSLISMCCVLRQILTVMILMMNIGNASLFSTITSSVASSLLKEMMFQKVETTTDLTTSQAFIKTLTFTTFKESSVISHKQGLKLTNLRKYALRLQKRYGLPDKYREELEDIDIFDKTNVVLRDFIFQSMGEGYYKYARIAAVKRNDDKIDFAMIFYNIGYRIAPKRVKRTVKKKFLGITYGKKSWIELVPIELSEVQIDHLKNVFNNRCIKELQNIGPPSLLNAPNIDKIDL